MCHDVPIHSLGTKRTSVRTIMQWDLTLYPYKIQVVQMFTAANKQRRRVLSQELLQFVQQYPATLDRPWISDEAHFQQWFLSKQYKRFQASQNPHRVLQTALRPTKCTVWCAPESNGLLYRHLCRVPQQTSGICNKC